MSPAQYAPPERFIHGLDGPTARVPGRVAAWLLSLAALDRIRIEVRGVDPEVDAVLVALRRTAMAWRDTALGTDHRNQPEPVPLSGVMSTQQVADALGVTDRAVRKAITGSRLPATKTDGRWQITAGRRRHVLAARQKE